jgi:hypothetical protein
MTLLVVLFVREPAGCAQGPSSSGSAPSERPEFRLVTRLLLVTTSNSSSPPPPDLRLGAGASGLSRRPGGGGLGVLLSFLLLLFDAVSFQSGTPGLIRAGAPALWSRRTCALESAVMIRPW